MLPPVILMQLGGFSNEQAEREQAFMLCEARIRHTRRMKQGVCAHCNKQALIFHANGDGYCRSHLPPKITVTR